MATIDSSEVCDSELHGLSLWEDAPEDIQRLILNHEDFSVTELAQVARTCKFFRRAQLDRRAIDEAWLEKAATSTFGFTLIQIVCSFLFAPQDNTKPLEEQHFDLTQGLSCPDIVDFQANAAILITPAGEACGANLKSVVQWRLQDTPRRGTIRRVVRCSLGKCAKGYCCTLFLNYMPGVLDAEFVAWNSCESLSAHLLPCLGLLHLLSKRDVAMQQEAGLEEPKGALHLSLPNSLALHDEPGAGNMLSGRGATSDVHRALDTLMIRHSVDWPQGVRFL